MDKKELKKIYQSLESYEDKSFLLSKLALFECYFDKPLDHGFSMRVCDSEREILKYLKESDGIYYLSNEDYEKLVGSIKDDEDYYDPDSMSSFRIFVFCDRVFIIESDELCNSIVEYPYFFNDTLVDILKSSKLRHRNPIKKGVLEKIREEYDSLSLEVSKVLLKLEISDIYDELHEEYEKEFPYDDKFNEDERD